jgi:hypothetical protein
MKVLDAGLRSKGKMHTKMAEPPDRPPRNSLLALVVTCIVIFTAGIILLVVGFVKFTRPYPGVPYFWSITLCRVNGTERWVGMELTPYQECPLVLKEYGESQAINIPAGILISSVPYIPVLYVTNKGSTYTCHSLNIM